MCIRDRIKEQKQIKEEIAKGQSTIHGLRKQQVEVGKELDLSLIHISEPTRLRRISYAVFCLKKKKKHKTQNKTHQPTN